MQGPAGPTLATFSLAAAPGVAVPEPLGGSRVIDGDDKTPLKFHFERYDQANQIFQVRISYTVAYRYQEAKTLGKVRTLAQLET